MATRATFGSIRLSIRLFCRLLEPPRIGYQLLKLLFGHGFWELFAIPPATWLALTATPVKTYGKNQAPFSPSKTPTNLHGHGSKARSPSEHPNMGGEFTYQDPQNGIHFGSDPPHAPHRAPPSPEPLTAWRRCAMSAMASTSSRPRKSSTPWSSAKRCTAARDLATPSRYAPSHRPKGGRYEERALNLEDRLVSGLDS